MPSKRLLSGLPNSLVQQYLSTLFYYVDGYMADWIWAVSADKKQYSLTLDIINKSIRPPELQIRPLVAYSDVLQETIHKTLVSNGFATNFIVEAQFQIEIPNGDKMPKLVTIQATLKDKDGKTYKGKKYEERSYGDPSLLSLLEKDSR